MVHTVALQIVADYGIVRYANILVENRVPNFGAASDVTIVQDYAILHERARVHPDAAPEYRVAHRSSGENAAAGDDRVDRLPAPVFLVESKFRRRVGIAGGSHGPFAVVQIQGR